MDISDVTCCGSRQENTVSKDKWMDDGFIVRFSIYTAHVILHLLKCFN